MEGSDEDVLILVTGLITYDVAGLMPAGYGCRILGSCAMPFIIPLSSSRLCTLLECSRMRSACSTHNSLSCYAPNVACLRSHDGIRNG
jgi:hypothetical protein